MSARAVFYPETTEICACYGVISLAWWKLSQLSGSLMQRLEVMTGRRMHPRLWSVSRSSWTSTKRTFINVKLLENTCLWTLTQFSTMYWLTSGWTMIKETPGIIWQFLLSCPWTINLIDSVRVYVITFESYVPHCSSFTWFVVLTSFSLLKVSIDFIIGIITF